MILSVHRRAFVLIVLWLSFSLAAVLWSPRPPAPPWPTGRSASNPLRAFGLSDEPTLLVFRRPGGLTLADWAFVNAALRTLPLAEGGVQVFEDAGQIQVIAVAPDVAEVATLRDHLREAPVELETYVTGAPAFAYDAGPAWSQVRLLVLAGVTVVTALAALLGGLNARGALVVAVSALSAAAVGSALAALVAPALSVALATVVSAGLAGAWATRLLAPHRPPPEALDSDRPPPEALDSAGPYLNPIRSKLAGSGQASTPLQRALVRGWETTLLQALIVAAGLTGLVFDLRSGLALFLGLAVAVAVSLSETPALVVTFAHPQSPRQLGSTVGHKWVRLALALIPLVGLLWLTPTMHPADAVTPWSEAAVGYALLKRAGQAEASTLSLGRLLPLHLLLQVPEDVHGEGDLTALQDLAEALSARPNLTAVEGATALNSSSQLLASGQTPAELTASFVRLEETAALLAVQLDAQADVLSQIAADLNELQVSVEDPAATEDWSVTLAKTLNGASERLDGMGQKLNDAGTELARAPVEFPELAPRLDDVPALRVLPDTLDNAVADLGEITADLRGAAAQANPSSSSQGDPLAPIRVDVARTAAILDTLSTTAARLQADLAAAEAAWGSATLDDSASSASNTHLVRHDLIRLTLVLADDPYAPAALGEVPKLIGVAKRALMDSWLSGGELSLTGASALAAMRQAQVWRQLLVPGVVVAALVVALFAWGTLLRAGQAFVLAGGALLSVAIGVGVAGALQCGDASAIALAGVALLALVGGRLATGRAPVGEMLVLVLPLLSLIVTGVAAMAAMSLILSAGLLINHFLIAPAFVHWSWRDARG